MATQDLPQYTAKAPQVEMPDGAEMVASRVAQFGSIVQNFTQKTVDYAGDQVGIKEKATEMVLKTNIDNAMRAFARSSTNQFDPKSGIQSFNSQADEYTNKLMEGVTGIKGQTIKAYADHAKATNVHPLEAAVTKQAFNEAKMNFLASVDSFTKDISQNISQVPLDEALSHHNVEQITPKAVKGQIVQGTIDMTDRPHVKREDGKISTVDSITIEEDGKYIVIPKVAPWGEVLSPEDAIDQYHQEGQHLGIFSNQKDADKYAKELHESEAKKLASGYVDEEGNPAMPPEQNKRIAPSIDSLQYNLTQVLQNIEVAGRAGLISPKQAQKLKEQVTNTANDEMLYHKYQLAVENGQGDAFIASYAKSQKGRSGAATFAKHIAEFKKIEHRNLAEQAITESTVREFTTDNLKNISKGKPSNTYADSLAESSPALFPTYAHDKQVAQLAGGLYQQFTAGTEQQALSMYAYLAEKNQHPDMPAGDRAIQEQALESALKDATSYFTELKADPQKFLLEKNLIGDIAQQQKIQQKTGVYLPDDLKVPEADTIKASIEWQRIHGIPFNQAQVLTNAQAREFAGKLMTGQPVDKVRMIQSINKQYGKVSSLVMQQLIDKGGLPKEYGWFTSLDPESGALPDMVNALTNTSIKYDSGQQEKVKSRVDKAMSIASERAHPDVSATRRFLGMAYQNIKGAVTGREFDAAATNTGLFGTPALFDERGTPADLKLKALTESMMSASGYNTGELLTTIDTSVNKLTNYYMTMRGLSEDDALSQAVRSITEQYQMVDYRDNIIRLPKQKINYNDLSVLLANTPELVNKIEWTFPLRGDYGSVASRTDQINYFKQNIENGHWATDPTDQGLVWVNANGMVNKMQNGNPLFVSFESLQKMQRLDFGKQDAVSYLNASYDLLKKNNASFNHVKMGVDNDSSVDIKNIPNAFGTFEKFSSMAVSRSKEFYDYLFQDQQARQRKFAQKEVGK